MKVKTIKLKDENPSKIVVEMDVREAVWIASIAGKQRGRPEDSPHSEIYYCLTSAFFNRFWEDGIDGACKEHWTAIPPIVYEDTERIDQ